VKRTPGTDAIGDVMPLVFGGAPLINVLVAMIIHPQQAAINPMLYLKAMLCVGVDYVLIGVLIPVVGPGAQGRLSSFDRLV